MENSILRVWTNALISALSSSDPASEAGSAAGSAAGSSTELFISYSLIYPKRTLY